HYDSLLAKLITWGDDRREALARMRRALREYLIAGLRTTIPFHRFMLDHPAFVQGELDTGLLERVWPGEHTSPEPDVVRVAAAVAALIRAREAPKDGTTSQDGSVAPRHSWWKYGGRPGAGRW
ncbi:MAG TPA: acetyl-CoA carboxylase biotin carboxylase subunit, partial [Chloroflexota bacterium]